MQIMWNSWWNDKFLSLLSASHLLSGSHQQENAQRHHEGINKEGFELETNYRCHNEGRMMHVGTASVSSNNVVNGNATNQLLSSGGMELLPNPVIGKGPLKPVEEMTILEKSVGFVGVFAIITAVLAMILNGSNPVVIMSGVISCFLGAYGYVQQTQITDSNILKETQIILEEQVSCLKAENQRFVSVISLMESSIEQLDELEQALTILNRFTGSNNSSAKMDNNIEQNENNDNLNIKDNYPIAVLRHIIFENKQLLKIQQANYKSQIISIIIAFLLRSDIVKNKIFDEEEIEALYNKFKQIPGLQIDYDNLCEALLDKHINAILHIVNNLLRSDQTMTASTIPVSERIFEFTRQ